MKKIVECVPNFSEGRNQETIEAIAGVIAGTPGCKLIDVDPGKSTNRTVYTFVGDPASVVEGALSAAREAKKRIDMRAHTGEHPRFGAMDVCPFVPVAGTTMEECVKIAEECGQRLADELEVPVYLYEQAARQDYRRKLPDVRQGEYEGLEKKLKDPDWKPDFGPSAFVPSWGATAVGARMFLVAYNVNILGTSNQAHRIALDLREAGRGEDQPGLLPDLKGIGWFVEEYNMAQASFNLNDYKNTPLHVVFEETKKDAARLNIGVAGSEIVGVVPLEAILMAADYYIEKETLFIYQEDQKIRLAVERLGLNSVAPFKPEEKIVEYIVADPRAEPLAGLTARAFIEEVGARTVAPGGGSVAAAVSAMGAALGAMAAKLTYGVRKFEHVDAHMRQAIPVLNQVFTDLIPMIDKDATAYTGYAEALKMHRDTPEQKAERATRMLEELKIAVEVPLSTMRLADQAWDALRIVAQHGNPASKSDVQVGARMLEAGIWGALQNVLINLKGIRDEKFKKERSEEAEAIARRAHKSMAEILEGFDAKTFPSA